MMRDNPGSGLRATVTTVEETNTTKTSWETGQIKEIVYRTVGEGGKLGVGHTDRKVPPLVPTDCLEAFADHRLRERQKAKARRGGTSDGNREREPHAGQRDNKKIEDYTFTEVRGLRFCTETRKYVDRDLSSAITIGRLRVMELLGLARPAPFCRTS